MTIYAQNKMAAKALRTNARGLPARMAAFFVGVAEGPEVVAAVVSAAVVVGAPALIPPVVAERVWLEKVVLRGIVMPVPVALAR